MPLLAHQAAAVAADASDPSLYVGKPVSAVVLEIEGRPTADPRVRALVETNAGKPLSMAEVRESVAHLYNLGRYEDVRVHAASSATGVALRYELVPVHTIARIVFSGMLDRLPTMRIITHHCGGMLPYFAGRAETLWAQLGSRTADEDYSSILKRMSKTPIEYFKMFYGDTVLGGSASALRCGLDFFGDDKVLFASDCPFDPEEGPMFIREGMRSIEDLNLSESDKRKIYFGNALKLLKMPDPGAPA